MLCYYIQKYGITSLAVAARKGREQVVDVLLKAGANPDIQDKVYNSYSMTVIVSACVHVMIVSMHADCIV